MTKVSNVRFNQSGHNGPKNLKELMQARKKKEIGQILNGDTNGYSNKNNITENSQQKVNTAPQKSSMIVNQKPSENLIKENVSLSNTKPAISLNENGTYDVKVSGQPTRTFSTEADAKKFLDNFNNTKAKSLATPMISLNERGTYDVKIAGEPTRTFSTEAEAKKFADNLVSKSKNKISHATSTPIEPGKAPFNKKFWGDSKINLDEARLSYTPQEQAYQLGKKASLSPIEAGKAPFNKKFWGDSKINLDEARLSYTPQEQAYQLGKKASLSPIEADKAPFNKKFWGDSKINLDEAKLSYTPQESAYQLGKNASLSPIEAGKAPFNKKFWGSGDIDFSKAEFKYNPNSSDRKILGKASEAVSELDPKKFSLKNLFSGKNLKQVFKGKKGKWGIAAGIIALTGSGVAAACAAGNSSKGYTTKTIQAPDGYLDLLKNYETTHQCSDMSYKRLEKLIA